MLIPILIIYASIGLAVSSETYDQMLWLILVMGLICLHFVHMIKEKDPSLDAPTERTSMPSSTPRIDFGALSDALKRSSLSQSISLEITKNELDELLTLSQSFREPYRMKIWSCPNGTIEWSVTMEGRLGSST